MPGVTDIEFLSSVNGAEMVESAVKAVGRLENVLSVDVAKFEFVEGLPDDVDGSDGEVVQC